MIRMHLGSALIARTGKQKALFKILLLIGIAILAIFLGLVMGITSWYISAIIIVACAMVNLIILRQEQAVIVCLLIIQLYADWYLNLHIISVIAALIFLLVMYLAQSPRYPWIVPRNLYLWIGYLILAIYPSIQGATDLYDAAFYYPNIIVGAFAFFWLGSIIVRDIKSIRRLFRMINHFSAIIAIHTIIQAATGTFLFASSHYDTFLQSVSNFQLSGAGTIITNRAGSFFVDPNWNGTFFAMMVFISLGCFVDCSSFLAKALYLIESLVMILALLFTYSNGAWLGLCGGIIAFALLAGKLQYRILVLSILFLSFIGILLLFPQQLAVQLSHVSDAREVSLRVAAWQTALNVIIANPLTGIGLGLSSYLQLSWKYHVPQQSQPLAHPHNSYLELGAMSGLPILIIFLTLLVLAIWRSLQNRANLDANARSLFGGGIAAIIALSVNSITINGWTLPPLAVMAWLILGALSSPLLTKKFKILNSARVRRL